MKNRAGVMGFIILAVAVAALWVFMFKKIFPIEPALYSLSGMLSL